MKRLKNDCTDKEHSATDQKMKKGNPDGDMPKKLQRKDDFLDQIRLLDDQVRSPADHFGEQVEDDQTRKQP